MKILYLTESVRWSGGAHQTLLMAGALRKRGHEIILGCQAMSDLVPRAKEAGVPMEFFRMRQDYDLPAALRIAKAMEARKIEILHAQHPTAHAVGLTAAYFSKVPRFVVTRRVVFPLRRNLFSRIKYLSKRIDGYVAISSAVKTELTKAGVDETRVRVIPSVIDAKVASAQDGAALRQELDIAPERPVVTTTSNYADFKGQDYLLAAAAEVVKTMPNVLFLLAGRETERLHPLVNQLKLDGNVRLLGFRTDVPRILAASTLFVLPSLQEAVSTALREALFSGLPCIGTRAGGIPESITDGQTGLLVPPADGGALAKAIIRLLQNPQEAAVFAEKGRAFVQSRFSLDTVSAQMEQFYRDLFTGKEPSAS